MFTVTSLAWTYSSLVASQRTQSREKQTERQRDDSVDGGGWRARLGMRGVTGEETTGTIDVRSRFSLVFLVYSRAVPAVTRLMATRANCVALGAAPLRSPSLVIRSTLAPASYNCLELYGIHPDGAT
jgi:hypothetical protein